MHRPTQLYIHVHAYTYTYMRTQYTYEQIYIYSCIQMYTYIHMCTRKHMCTRVHAYIIKLYIHTYSYKGTHLRRIGRGLSEARWIRTCNTDPNGFVTHESVYSTALPLRWCEADSREREIDGCRGWECQTDSLITCETRSTDTGDKMQSTTSAGLAIGQT